VKKAIALIIIFFIGFFLGWRILPPRGGRIVQQPKMVAEIKSQSLKEIEIEKKVEAKVSLPQIKKIKTIIYYE